MGRVAIALGAALMLAGCATTPQQKAEQASMDDAECQSWGLLKEDPRYAQCRALLTDRRAKAETALTTGVLNVLAHAGPPPPIPTSNATSCTSSAMGGTVFTNCY